jgi:hypothetical protein
VVTGVLFATGADYSGLTPLPFLASAGRGKPEKRHEPKNSKSGVQFGGFMDNNEFQKERTL